MRQRATKRVTLNQLKEERAAWNLLAKDLEKINRCKYLTMTQKHILSEFASLAVRDGFSRAGDDFLSQKWNISKSRVSYHIKKLKQEEFIRVEYEGRERHIFIEYDTIRRMESESRRGSLFIPATHIDFFDNFSDVPSWRRDRKLNQALKDYIRACHKEGLHVKKVDVKKQAQYLIDHSAGNIQEAISIVDKAIDEGKQIC